MLVDGCDQVHQGQDTQLDSSLPPKGRTTAGIARAEFDAAPGYIAAVTEGEGRRVAGRYLLVRQLGSGGMGRVWLAWDERLRRNVAVKEVLPRAPWTGGDADPVVSRTLREARAAAKLRHPGIITVYDTVYYDGQPWIIMELIDGPSLADYLRDEEPLALRRAAEIAIKVIEALDAAHRAGVLHRDVKPSNIMLDGDRVVLTDFGIAVIEGATVLTLSGQLIGAPEFIAPERIDGHEATSAADLWAVGITLYNMIVGDTPFRRAATSETFAAIATKEPRPHSAIGPLWPVVQGLLEKKPAERLTATAAVEKLREVLAQPPVQQFVLARVPPVLPPTQPATIPSESTAPDTRHDAPAFVPGGEREPVVGPGDVTLDPVPTRRPVRWTWIAVLVGIAALLAAAVVVTKGLIAGNGSGGGGAVPTSSVQASPVFIDYSEALGFSINVPENYARQASAVSTSTVSDVVWQAAQPDPRIGTLLVEVQRDDTARGIKPIDYLSAKDRAESTDNDNLNYRRLSIAGQSNGPATWEYTHTSAASGDQFQVRTLAVTSGNAVYVLTFSLYAQDAATLDTQWRTAQPIMDKIRASFHLTS